MKKPQHLFYFFLLYFSLILMSSCTDQVEITRTYTLMEPIYMSPQEIRDAVEITAPETLSEIGKIYLYGDFVFVNEPGEGIHVIKNDDPANPEIVKFIQIPGNYNMSVRGDIIYADSYMDLVAVSIKNMENIEVVHRAENIFTSFNNQNYYDPEKGVIVDWKAVETIEVTSSEVGGAYPSYYNYDEVNFAFKGSAMEASNASRAFFAPPSVQTGVGGSMARFAIYGNYMYGIDDVNLYVFDISNLEEPVYGFKKEVGWGIETIFPYQDKLFIGAQNGMHIYDISKPDIPLKLSTFEHVVSCDPVVVQDTIAYVTLRGGNNCRNGFSNQLDVVNIKDPSNPILIESFPMQNPHGLGIDGKALFICEGSFGLKIYDASDVHQIPQHIISEFKGLDAYDVIPYNNLLLMIGGDGLYQFDYTDLTDIKLLSGIPVTAPINPN
ncbi:MAG: LVIVD repeat-containing protein [Candidatus Cyclobacteriaceae bacterium M3_2C_046]